MEITFQDNQPVIDLISKKPNGLLVILETHGMLNRKPNDLALVTSFNQAHHISIGNSQSFMNTPPNVTPGGYSPLNKSAMKGRNSSFYVQPNNQSQMMLTPPPPESSADGGGSTAYKMAKFSRNTFSINHFAGQVTYTIDGFLMKNNDALQDDLVFLLNFSTNNFLASVAGLQTQTSADTVPARNSGSTKMATTSTVSSQFREQLDSLMHTLRQTNPHYIKCIKPNSEKRPRCFDSDLVMQQLRYSGVLEVVRIRREGFPVRVSFLEFYNSYKILLGIGNNKNSSSFELTNDEQARPFAAKIAAKALPSGSFQVGHSQLFLKDRCTQKLKAAVQKYFHSKAVVMQSFFRQIGYWRRRLYRRKATIIQKTFRMYARTRYLRVMRVAVRTIRRFWLARKLALNLQRRVTNTRRKAAPIPRSLSPTPQRSDSPRRTYSEMIRSHTEGMKRIASGVFAGGEKKEKIFKRALCTTTAAPPAILGGGVAVIKVGWLRKRKNGVIWQRRWAVLTEDHLTYYRSPDTLDQPKFTMPLKDCSVVRLDGKDPIIEVRSPHIVEKRSILSLARGGARSGKQRTTLPQTHSAANGLTSGSSNVNGKGQQTLALLAESEGELLEWLLPLQAVAKVGTLKSGVHDCQSPVSVHTANLARYCENKSPNVKTADIGELSKYAISNNSQLDKERSGACRLEL
mmetsp:Transcript_24289/g.34812  ORF Transcript_24289/g.34812 Transcript_24289/m.34812 type:complete len:685 (-) Transcript_24289:302-2356(-)